MIEEDGSSGLGPISALYCVFKVSKKYDEAVGRLNGLTDEVGTDEHHPLYSLLDTLGTVIHAYEDKHYPMPKCRGVTHSSSSWTSTV
jgi:HTH-type transcriptional regulator/antitoxin HigA